MSRSHVFISYSHADSKWLSKLSPFLKVLERDYGIKTWDDTAIKPGSRWKEEIKQELQQAKVALLLVSQHFLASDFITDQELPHFLKASEKEGLTILWVAVSPSMWEGSPIAQFQATNDPGRPLDSLPAPKLKSELVKIAKSIQQAINRAHGKKEEVTDKSTDGLFSLSIEATSFAGDYPPNTEIVGFKWMPETTDVRLTLTNGTESDFENLDLKFGSDLLTMTVLQITRIPNVSFIPQDDGKLKLPSAASIGKDASGKSVIIPTAPSSPNALILSSYYRLLCDRLPHGEKLQLVLPSRATNPWNGNPNEYFTHKRDATFITVKGEFFANKVRQIVDVKIIPAPGVTQHP